MQQDCMSVGRGESLNIIIYYINTSEIPGGLSRENVIPSHVKITCYLHTWKDHRWYRYMINRAFCNDLVFHLCSYNKQSITWLPGDTKFLFSCWKISLVRAYPLYNQRDTLYPNGFWRVLWEVTIKIAYMFLTRGLHKDNYRLPTPDVLLHKRTCPNPDAAVSVMP